MASKNDKDLNGQWGTHMPILARAMELTDGPVLELGTGVWSTALMHMMASESKRKVVSYDNDPTWHESNLKWQSDFHDILVIPEDGWDDIPIEKTFWSVVLVDHKPAKRRMKEIERLAKNALIVLIHDSEPESDKFFKYSWIYKFYKYRYDYTKCRPYTTALSNFIDVAKLLA